LQNEEYDHQVNASGHSTAMRYCAKHRFSVNPIKNHHTDCQEIIIK